MAWKYSSFYIDRYPRELHPRLRLGDPTLIYLGYFFLQDYLREHLSERCLPPVDIAGTHCFVGELLDESERTSPHLLLHRYAIRILGPVDFTALRLGSTTLQVRVAMPSEHDIPHIAFSNLRDYTEAVPCPAIPSR